MKSLLLRITPRTLMSAYHFALAFLSTLYYGFPSRRLTVIGVTGTNGKTTVVQFVSHILEAAGHTVGHVSSVDFKIGSRRWKNELKMTMPGRFFLQRLLRQMVNAGCAYAVMEVTSEGIVQHRHRFINFAVAAITNVTPEHLERHGGFAQYRAAKGQLFSGIGKRGVASLLRSDALPRSKVTDGVRRGKTRAGVSVINLDDPNAEYFLQFPADKTYLYSQNPDAASAIHDLKPAIRDSVSEIRATSASCGPDGIRFTVDGTAFRLNILGQFNVSNALAAIAIAFSQGIDLPAIARAAATFTGVPGRMEVVRSEPFTVIVDYAHTPDALEKVYHAIASHSQQPHHEIATPPTASGARNDKKERRLICVLGSAGGGRDKWKRPEMGKIAARHCAEIILTNEDPYDENPDEILSEIESGLSQSLLINPHTNIPNYRKILNRHDAIKTALALARPGDTVIITGKGAEPWLMGANGTKIPWDDREIVRDICQKSVL